MGSGELDIELGPYAVSNTEPGANSRPSQHGQKSDQWKTLFMNMDGMLSVEGGKLVSPRSSAHLMTQPAKRGTHL